jgi:Tol biopolymer transport system component
MHPRGARWLLVCVVLSLASSVGPGRARDEQWPPNTEIVAVDLSGHETNLTHNPALDTRPSVSRDGRIVFLSTRDGPADLYVMDNRGRNVHRLTTSPFTLDGGEIGWNDAGYSEASWSRRGKKIAFDVQHTIPSPTCFSNCVTWGVYVSRADGTGLRTVGAGEGRAPAWSADGRSLAYEEVADAYGDIGGVTIARLDGSGSVTLRGENPDEVGPVWSPTANELAFQARAPGRRAWSYLVRGDGQRRYRLAQGARPTWSPDGQRIAFIRNSRLMTIRIDGKQLRPLSPKGEPVEAASWSPKGDKLALVVGNSIDVLSAEGKHLRPLGSVGASTGVRAPAWTPDGKRIVYVVG